MKVLLRILLLPFVGLFGVARFFFFVFVASAVSIYAIVWRDCEAMALAERLMAMAEVR